MKIENIEIAKINREAKTNNLGFVFNCENNYRQQVNSIANHFLKLKVAKFVLISGPSSAGKTTTSKLLQEQFNKKGFKAFTISLDDFFVERDETPILPSGEKDFESVDSIDWKLFDTCMSALLAKKPIKLPTFNFKSGCKEFVTDEKILDDDEFVIIEGLHALNPVIDNFIPKSNRIKIYLNVLNTVTNNIETLSQQDIRLTRRIIRDIETRGYSPEHTLKTWGTVCDGEKKYISPFKNMADFTINTFHPYELCIYSYIYSKLNLLADNNPTLKKLNDFLSTTEEIDPDYVPSSSLLQEFINLKF